MAEKLPPASGRAVRRLLESYGFVVIRQRGSHARFALKGPASKHQITVPMHTHGGRRTLDGILEEAAFFTGVPKDELIRRLRRLRRCL